MFFPVKNKKFANESQRTEKRKLPFVNPFGLCYYYSTFLYRCQP